MPFVDSLHPGRGGQVALQTAGPSTFTLLEALTYQGQQDTFVVPEGFETDFASVPRILVWLIPRYGKWTKAAILHDWLWREAIPKRLVSPPDADGLFRRVLRELDVPIIKRWMMWAAVRWGSLFVHRTRSGFLKSSPLVVFWTAVGLPLAAPIALIATCLVLYGGADWITSGSRWSAKT